MDLDALTRERIEVREATPADHDAIMDMRAAYEREFVGQVEVPANAFWFVAVRGSRVLACTALAYAGQRRIIVTDLYCDGTFAGRRGLVLLIKSGFGARATLFVSVPFDRPRLKEALERRGIVFKAWHGEYHP